MEYNDMKSRLSRTLLSLNGRFDDDVNKYIRIEKWGSGQGLSIIFGNEDEDEILNKIMIILYNLSSLKDHIKNRLTVKGMNPKMAEDEINNSLHLQVLIDVVNQEKHGAPLRRSRSNKSPVIRYPSIGYFPFINKDGSIIDNDEDVGCMVIKALIKDEMENLIFTLDELVETCFTKWDSFITTNNLL